MSNYKSALVFAMAGYVIAQVSFCVGYESRCLQASGTLCIETEPLEIGKNIQSDVKLGSGDIVIQGALEVVDGQPLFYPAEPATRMTEFGLIEVYEPIKLCENHNVCPPCE
jgi:hypothetical protein